MACLLLAAVSALDAAHGSAPASRPPERTAAVVVAVRDLPAGRVLTGRDLAVRRWPKTIRPPGSAGNPRDRVGERLAGPVRAGEAVTATRTVGSSLTDGLAPGLAAVPVSLADGRAAALVRPGEHIELLATDRDGTDALSGLDDSAGTSSGARPSVTVVAPRLLVLAVLPSDQGGADTSTSLIVAADHDTTMEIARRETTAYFTAAALSP